LKEEKFKSAVSPALNITPHNFQIWTFQHKELLTATGNGRPWDQKKLVNKLNHINFIDSYVFILLRNRETDKHILIKAYPQPCIKDELICRLDLQDNLLDQTKYSLDYLMIDDGLTAILAPVKLVNVEGNTLKLNLPDESRVIKTRKTRRHYCHGITCEVIQDDFNAQGTLVDFTPSAFGIELTRHKKMKGFDEKKPALINLYQNSTKFFSGSCRCILCDMGLPNGKIIFAPLQTQMAIFPKRKIRNPRQQITPSFTINFKHPLFHSNVERDIFEISTSGFSVRDNMEEETLLPGMIIPNMSIVYAGILKMDCAVQILYRHEDKNNNVVQCGLAITDMDVQSYSNFNHILGMYLDGNAHVSREVDMDALWEFFFDAGFIYGEKYEHIQSYHKIFKETYRKLYQDNPDISQHFVYKKNGRIYGHMSMVHAYNPSWVIHHFAARPLEGKITGLIVFRQLMHYVNGFYRFSSGGMDYVIAYYRPENEIMTKIFGGVVDHLGNRKESSLDLFSYSHIPKESLNRQLSPKWVLRESIPSDFVKLTNFYENHSGGLLLDALDLNSPMKPLRESFLKTGFRRNCKTFCLCHKEEQVAFFILDQSDLGLNLSDLLNSIKIIIINETELKWDIVASAINKISSFYKEEQISLLVYPSDYLCRQGFSANKNYQLWILKISPTSDRYHEYMKSKFRIRYRTE
jgi:hypothetical protein